MARPISSDTVQSGMKKANDIDTGTIQFQVEKGFFLKAFQGHSSCLIKKMETFSG